MNPWSVLILSRHVPDAASSRLRTFQYIPFLEAAGATVSTRSFFDATYLTNLYIQGERNRLNVARAYLRRLKDSFHARRYSVVWLEKELFPYLPGFFERELTLLGIPYVVDYDDASFHTYDQHRNPMIRSILGNKLDGLIRGAQTITVGNSYLGSYAEHHGARRVVRIPTVVDLRRYAVSPMHPSNRFRVGWIGTPATTKYLKLLEAPLLQLNQIIPLTLVTIGASPIQPFGVPLEQHPWSEDSEAALLSTIHAGVMPLPEEPWERGKCGYKLVQYMASGRPVVASPVGVNSDLVSAEVGFLASSTSEWVNALAKLSESHERCASMGIRGRELVEREYSIQVTAPKVVSVLREAAAGHTPS